MSIFKIEGGHRLQGEIIPQGAKNEALQIVCATLLTASKVTISNIPDIRDVNKLIFILGELGVKIEKLDRNTYTFQADDINLKYLESLDFKKMEVHSRFNYDRGSITYKIWKRIYS